VTKINALNFLMLNFLSAPVPLHFLRPDIQNIFGCCISALCLCGPLLILRGDELEDYDAQLSAENAPQNGTWILTSLLAISFAFLKPQRTYSRFAVRRKCVYFLQHSQKSPQRLSSHFTFVLRRIPFLPPSHTSVGYSEIFSRLQMHLAAKSATQGYLIQAMTRRREINGHCYIC
jgi:hypothetical protein